MIARPVSERPGERQSASSPVLKCESCAAGYLRMESDPLTGQVSESCGTCGYSSRHRGAEHQARVAAIVAAQPAKYKHRKPRRS